jgi:hypothetical protein
VGKKHRILSLCGGSCGASENKVNETLDLSLELIQAAIQFHEYIGQCERPTSPLPPIISLLLIALHQSHGLRS